MKKIQAGLFAVLMIVASSVFTSTVASAAQKLSATPVSETSSQSAYGTLVMIIEIVCPLPYGWPLV